MSSIKDIMDNLPETTSDESVDPISDPKYMDSAAHVIRDAVEKGFDVIQLENGDIVTTGTKVVITQYGWDGSKGEMIVRSRTEKDVE